jgi:diguanylate cyclase (GGDEF)-like protein/PAS domain S-box-containing protein
LRFGAASLLTDVIRFLEACPTPAVAIAPDDQIVFANRPAVELLELDDGSGWPRFTEVVPEWRSKGSIFRAPIESRSRGARDCEIAVTRGIGDVDTVAVALITGQQFTDYLVDESNKRLKFIIEMLPQAICVFDAEDRYVLWNERYAELYSEIAGDLRQGIPFEEILEISLASGHIKEVVSDKQLWLKERMEKFHRPTSQEEQQLRDGRWLRHDDRRTPDGGAIGMRVDITELKQREIWLRELFEANPMPMLLCDGENLAILQVNSAAVDFYGFEKTDLTTKTPLDLHVEDQRSDFAAALIDIQGHRNARTIWRQRTADGRQVHVLIYVRLVYEGTSKRLLLTIADVSDRVHAEQEANRLAHHDPLTGLPNRMQFYKALDGALKARGEGELVVYCLDLDGFKPVNDTFGHAAGDAVLVEVAERLRQQEGEFVVARLGGDEFAMLFQAANSSKTALADRCLAALELPFTVKGIPIRIGVSIGIASAPMDGNDGEALIQASDRALYMAKEAGRGIWKLASDHQTSQHHFDKCPRPRSRSTSRSGST